MDTVDTLVGHNRDFTLHVGPKCPMTMATMANSCGRNYLR